MDFDAFLQQAMAVVAEWTPLVLGALAVFFGGWLFAAWARGFARKALQRSRVDPGLIPFLTGLIYIGLIALVVVATVGVLGVTTASFVAVIGAAGLAIALAFQGTFSHFAAGVMLLSFRPFKPGDFIEVAGEKGTVVEVGIFSVILATPDNVQVRVPNSEVFGNTMKNYSANEDRRIDLVVGVGYDDDLGVAVRTCQDVVTADPRVLSEPAPVVAVSEMGDSSVNLVVRPWVKTADYWPARFDLVRGLKEQLEAAGCSIPYPQRDVHLFRQTAD